MIFEELEVGQELPSLARLVTREDVKAYADVGGDQNPLHQDDDLARSVGFDGIIAHGMFTMGHMAACVVEWAGPAAWVSAISAQFRAPVSMGDTVVASARVIEIDAEQRSATLEAWVTLEREGVTGYPVRRGGAVVRF